MSRHTSGATAIAFVMSAALVAASGPIGVYGIVEKVVIEPRGDRPAAQGRAQTLGTRWTVSND